MFRLVKILNGRINQGEPVRLPSNPETEYSCGEALQLSSGKLTRCSATTKPTFICCEDHSSSSTDPRDILVEPVTPEMIFEVPFSEDPEGLTVGSKVTLDVATGTAITSTTASGVATIFDLAGAKAAGDKCLVQFK